MDPFVPDDAQMRRMLAEARTVAVVGLSDDPSRASHGVARYLHRQGYRIVPVNPRLSEIWGLKSYPSLSAAHADGLEIDLVDVFRAPEHVGPIVEEAIQVGVKAIWFQEGVVNLEAAQRAKDAGLGVVMDRCTFKEHVRLVR